MYWIVLWVWNQCWCFLSLKRFEFHGMVEYLVLIVRIQYFNGTFINHSNQDSILKKFKIREGLVNNLLFQSSLGWGVLLIDCSKDNLATSFLWKIIGWLSFFGRNVMECWLHLVNCHFHHWQAWKDILTVP